MRPCKKKVMLMKRIKTPNSLDEFIITKEPYKYYKSYPIYIVKRNQCKIHESFDYKTAKAYMDYYIDLLKTPKSDEGITYKEGF